ncbi:MAG TPA: hypothetical protein VG013_37550 [Gemmataceae bacterium]|jgi:uncharacterized protein (TIGR02996 family)|nr:hypothetical protein [Gemmataceae bacterium]
MGKEENRLLKGIARSPWAHSPRLEYAAWVERQGDGSRSEQAEFLRLDVEHEQISEAAGGPHVYCDPYDDRFSQVRQRLRDLSFSLDPHWLVRVDRDLAIPPELSPRGKKAARLILDFLLAEGLTGTCGCQAFHSPQQWKERGEEYGHDSLLILVYDGGDITTCMDPTEGQHDLVDRFENNLIQNGYVVEACTNWYSAIYDEKDYKPFFIELG